MAIVDNNVLSSLAKASRLDLLPTILGEARTTPEVEREFRDERIAGFDFVEAVDHVKTYGEPTKDAWLQVVTQSPAERELSDGLLDEGLAPPDASCLAAAMGRGEMLVTDDQHLGRVAQARGVDVIDLETFLLAAAHGGHLGSRTEAVDLLRTIEQRDFYTYSAGFEESVLRALEEG